MPPPGYLQPRLGSGIPYSVPRGTWQCADGRWVGDQHEPRDRGPPRARPHRSRRRRGAARASPVGWPTGSASTPAWRRGWPSAPATRPSPPSRPPRRPPRPSTTWPTSPSIPTSPPAAPSSSVDGVTMQGLVARLSATPGEVPPAGRPLGADQAHPRRRRSVGRRCRRPPRRSGVNATSTRSRGSGCSRGGSVGSPTLPSARGRGSPGWRMAGTGTRHAGRFGAVGEGSGFVFPPGPSMNEQLVRHREPHAHRARGHALGRACGRARSSTRPTVVGHPHRGRVQHRPAVRHRRSRRHRHRRRRDLRPGRLRHRPQPPLRRPRHCRSPRSGSTSTPVSIGAGCWLGAHCDHPPRHEARPQRGRRRRLGGARARCPTTPWWPASLPR